MSIDLDNVKMPEIPQALHLFGVPGKQAFRRFSQEIQSGKDNLEVIRDYEKGEKLFDEYVNSTENDETKNYAEVAGDVSAEAEKDEEAMAAELKAIEDKYAAREDARLARLNEAKDAVLASATDLEIPSDEDKADAVVGWDLARASLEDFKRRVIKSLQNRQVANPEFDPSKDESPENEKFINVERLINSISFPAIGFGEKKVSTRGAGGWKPRFSKAIVDGTELSAPQVSAVAKHIGISNKALLDSLQRHYSRETVDGANDGTEFSFVVHVEKDGKGSQDMSVTLTKGQVKSEKETATETETETVTAE